MEQFIKKCEEIEKTSSDAKTKMNRHFTPFYLPPS